MHKFTYYKFLHLILLTANKSLIFEQTMFIMEKFTIIFNKKNRKYFKGLLSKLNTKTKLGYNFFIVYFDRKNYRLTNKIKHQISATILLIFKKEFFKINLQKYFLTKTQVEHIIKCIMMIDFNNELKFVFNNLSIDGTLNLESYYYFRLNQLQLKWKIFINDVFNISNNNNSISTLYFIKYLININQNSSTQQNYISQQTSTS